MKQSKIQALKIAATLLIIFLCVSFRSRAQQSYTRKQIKEFKLVKDVFRALPDSATRIYYEVMGKIGGTVMHYTGKGETLNDDARLLMSTADLGSKIYFDLTYGVRSSTMVHAKTMSFKVVK